MSVSLEAEIRNQGGLQVAGLFRQHGQMPSPAIPSQWQDFGPYIGSIPGQIGQWTYGIVPSQEENSDVDTHDYLCAVEVSDLSLVHPPLRGMVLPAQSYAVFTHLEHVSRISETFSAAYNDWLPGSDFVAVPGACIEAYGETFDPRTGNGGFEVWIPVAPA